MLQETFVLLQHLLWLPKARSLFLPL